MAAVRIEILLLSIFLSFNIVITSTEEKFQLTCASNDCTVAICEGITISQYPPRLGEHYLTFNSGEPLMVFGKSEKFWYVEINKKRGLAPPNLITEGKQLVKKEQLVNTTITLKNEKDAPNKEDPGGGSSSMPLFSSIAPTASETSTEGSRRQDFESSTDTFIDQHRPSTVATMDGMMTPIGSIITSTPSGDTFSTSTPDQQSSFSIQTERCKDIDGTRICGEDALAEDDTSISLTPTVKPSSHGTVKTSPLPNLKTDSDRMADGKDAADTQTLQKPQSWDVAGHVYNLGKKMSNFLMPKTQDNGKNSNRAPEETKGDVGDNPNVGGFGKNNLQMIEETRGSDEDHDRKMKESPSEDQRKEHSSNEHVTVDTNGIGFGGVNGQEIFFNSETQEKDNIVPKINQDDAVSEGTTGMTSDIMMNNQDKTVESVNVNAKETPELPSTEKPSEFTANEKNNTERNASGTTEDHGQDNSYSSNPGNATETPKSSIPIKHYNTVENADNNAVHRENKQTSVDGLKILISSNIANAEATVKSSIPEVDNNPENAKNSTVQSEHNETSAAGQKTLVSNIAPDAETTHVVESPIVEKASKITTNEQNSKVEIALDSTDVNGKENTDSNGTGDTKATQKMPNPDKFADSMKNVHNNTIENDTGRVNVGSNLTSQESIVTHELKNEGVDGQKTSVFGSHGDAETTAKVVSPNGDKNVHNDTVKIIDPVDGNAEAIETPSASKAEKTIHQSRTLLAEVGQSKKSKENEAETETMLQEEKKDDLEEVKTNQTIAGTIKHENVTYREKEENDSSEKKEHEVEVQNFENAFSNQSQTNTTDETNGSGSTATEDSIWDSILTNSSQIGENMEDPNENIEEEVSQESEEPSLEDDDKAVTSRREGYDKRENDPLSTYGSQGLIAEEDADVNSTPSEEDYLDASTSLPDRDDSLTWIQFLRESVQAMIDILPLPIYQSLLEMKASGLSLNATVVTFFTGLLSILLLSVNLFFRKRSKEIYLNEKLCYSEQQLFKMSKERDVLRDELNTAKQQSLTLHRSLQEQQNKTKPIQKQLEDVKSQNGELFALAESLRGQLGVQQGAVEQLQEERAHWTTQSQILRERAEVAEGRAIALSQELEERSLELGEMQLCLGEKESQEEETRSIVERLEQTRDRLLVEAQEWNERVTELRQQLESSTWSEAEATRDLDAKQREIEALKESMDSLCFLNNADCAVEGDVLPTIKEKLHELLDVAKVKLELKCVRELLDVRDGELDAKRQECSQMEARLADSKAESAVVKENYQKAQLESLEAQTKLEVLSTYFREKETHLQKELGTQVAIRQQNEDVALTAEQRVADIIRENATFKDQMMSMKVELQETERSLKAQALSQEKKAHENWLAARGAERKLEEAKQESAALRQRLTLLERERDSALKLLPKKQEDVNGELTSSDLEDPDSSSSLPPSTQNLPFPPPFPLPLDRPMPPPPFHMLPPPPPFGHPGSWRYHSLPPPPIHPLDHRMSPLDFERRSFHTPLQGHPSPPHSRGWISPPGHRRMSSPPRNRRSPPPYTRGRASPPLGCGQMSPPYSRGRMSPPLGHDRIPPIPGRRTSPPPGHRRMSPPPGRGRVSPPRGRNGYRPSSPPHHYDYGSSERFSPVVDTPPRLPRFHDGPPLVPVQRRDLPPSQPTESKKESTRPRSPKHSGPTVPV